MNEHTTALVDFLAAQDDFDTFDLIPLLQPFMPDNDFRDFALSFDVCPMHLCDVEICMDDDVQECAPLR